MRQSIRAGVPGTSPSENARDWLPVQNANSALYRAYIPAETSCYVLDGRQVHVAARRLGERLAWAQRSRDKPFIRLVKTIKEHEEGILRYVSTRLTNAFAEGINSEVRTGLKQAYGF